MASGYVLPATLLTGNTYDPAGAGSIYPVYGGRGGRFFVSGGNVFVQLAYGVRGGEQWTIEQEAPPGPGTIDAGAIGIQFRNADGTVPATVSATIQPPHIPGIQLGSSGVSTPASASMITGIIPAAGTTPTAGSGFTYTHTNGTGIYVFTFNTAFANTPVILLSSSGTRVSGQTATYTAVSATGFTANLWNTITEAGQDAAFNFIAEAVS
jgi:hypothetical protein